MPGSLHASSKPPFPTPPTPCVMCAASVVIFDFNVRRKTVDVIGAQSKDEGVLTEDNITVAASIGVPIALLALLVCVCARRRSRQREANSASVGARDSYQKSGGPSGLGGLGGHADNQNKGLAAAGGGIVGGSGSIVGGARKESRTGSNHSFRIAPSMDGSPKSRNSTGEVNLAEHLSVGGHAVRNDGERVGEFGIDGGGGRYGRGRGGADGGNPRQLARRESGTAFAVTTDQSSFAEDDSAAGTAMGRSSSPTDDYDDDDLNGSYTSAGDNSDLDSVGWGSKATGGDVDRLPPPQEDAPASGEMAPFYNTDQESKQSGGQQHQRSPSFREKNSDRALARAMHAGRPGVPRRREVRAAIAKAADADASRGGGRRDGHAALSGDEL